MKFKVTAYRAIIVSFFLGATALLAQGNPDWHQEFPAFRIAGNIYYVGTADLAVYLITTPQGHILLNIDPDGYKAYVAERNEAFQKEWARQFGTFSQCLSRRPASPQNSSWMIGYSVWCEV